MPLAVSRKADASQPGVLLSFSRWLAAFSIASAVERAAPVASRLCSRAMSLARSVAVSFSLSASAFRSWVVEPEAPEADWPERVVSTVVMGSSPLVCNYLTKGRTA
jgi:hypothetical protein